MRLTVMKQIILLGTMVWGMTTGLTAQSWDLDRRGPRVIVYEDANFRGQSLILYPGDRLENLKQVHFDGGKRVNDRISSIRVEGGATIVLYDHPQMKGQVLRTTSDIHDLEYHRMPDLDIPWNDRISSLRVGGRGHGVSGPMHRPPAMRNPDAVIKKAYEDVLGRSADREGLRYYRGLVIDQGWTDRMIRRHMRQSEEYRSETVDRMIRRAYEDILEREADPSGLANYRRLMIEENWTERQVRNDLRRSTEYRNRLGS